MIQDVNTTDVGFIGAIDFPEFSDYLMYLNHHISDRLLTLNIKYTFQLETSIESDSLIFLESLIRIIQYFNIKEVNLISNWFMIVNLSINVNLKYQ